MGLFSTALQLLAVSAITGVASAGSCHGKYTNTTNSVQEYDFIIVGGGTTGAYLAHKLSTQSTPPASVLLLEVGKDTIANSTGSPLTDPGVLTHMPSNLLQNVTSPYTRTTYTTAPQLNLANREIQYQRGIGLGGTSLVNYMGWSKGYKGDYDDWASVAGDSAYDSVEGWQRIKNLETLDPYLPTSHKDLVDIQWSEHGTTGPVKVGFGKTMLPGVKSFVEAATEIGQPLNKDHNSGKPVGVSLSNQAVYKGVRFSSAAGFLNYPGSMGPGVSKPQNLDVKVESRVDKIIFGDDQTAKGVKLQNGNEYYASKEVILSAGFIESPKILLLSGVGPRKELEDLGIDVVCDSPYVGKNLRDHSSVLMNPQFNEDLELPSMLSLRVEPKRMEEAQQQWVDSYDNGRGEAFGEMSRFGSAWGVNWIKYPACYRQSWPEWSTLTQAEKDRFNDPARPDSEVVYLEGYNPTFAPFPPGSRPNPSATLLLLNQNTLSRGEIKLASSDPSIPPIVDPNYFSSPMDKRIAVETIKSAMNILKAPTYKNVCQGVEFLPQGGVPVYLARTEQQIEIDDENTVDGFYTRGLSDTSDEGILNWLTNKGLDQGYHGLGTCKMGSDQDPMRVVDGSGKVVGVKNLRVADTSVVPVILVNHPMVSAYLVGDVVADRILDQWKIKKSSCSA